MRVILLAIGDKMPKWVQAGFDEYAKRLSSSVVLDLRQIRAGRRTKGVDLARLIDDEGRRLLAAVPANTRLVALDRGGQALSTEELAGQLRLQMDRGEDLALMVGGPEGLSTECIARAQATWSLSRLTLAHPVVRVVVAEQVYRAWSILNNLPYHR